MRQSTTRRQLRTKPESLNTTRDRLHIDDKSQNFTNCFLETLCADRGRGWTAQATGGLGSVRRRPCATLCALSIVFLCIGCLIFLMPSNKGRINLTKPTYKLRGPAIIIAPGNSAQIDPKDQFQVESNTEVQTEPEDDTQTEKEENAQTEEDEDAQTEVKEWDVGDDEDNDLVEMVLNAQQDSVAVAPSGPSAPHSGIEFVMPGNFVPFPSALSADYPHSPTEDFIDEEIRTQVGNLKRKTSQVKLFIGVASDCCSEKSLHNRNEIRATWMKSSKNGYPDIGIKFFIGQPARDELSKAAGLLSEEVRRFDDLVLIRGHDVFGYLPAKTLGIMKYSLASSQNYTHILKTDDDCYVRVHKLIENLNGTNLDGVYKGWLVDGSIPSASPPLDVAKGLRYLAGWGYILSRDVMLHALRKVLQCESNPSRYCAVKQEDILLGTLVEDLVSDPVADSTFKAAWDACTNQTTVKHLDVDAPALFRSLYIHDKNGTWNDSTVECSSGSYEPGDLKAWKRWRDSMLVTKEPSEENADRMMWALEQ